VSTDAERAAATDAVLAAAPRADFVELLRVLEQVAAGARLGTDAPPRDERIRLRHSIDLAFAPSDVLAGARTTIALEGGAPAQGVELTAAFLGLGGATGALPSYLAEELQQEDPDAPVRRELTDLFHHRALSLLYRLLARHRVPSEIADDAGDRWSARMRALGGEIALRAEGIEPRLRMELLPALVGRRSARSLRASLEHVLRRELGEVDVEIREHAAGRVQLGETERARLGVQRHALGRSAMLGRSVADAGSVATLVLRPIDAEGHARLLPGGDLHALVCRVFRPFDRTRTQLRLELHLRDGEGTRVGRGARLGRSAWLSRQRAARVITIDAMVDPRTPARSAGPSSAGWARSR
jgi:type VI secretion system protein ImpH